MVFRKSSKISKSSKSSRPVQSKIYRKKSNKNQMVPRGLAAMVKKITLKTQETKRSVYANSDGVDLVHSTLHVLDQKPLKTTNGVSDPLSVQTLNRIGDQVSPVGLSIKFMVGLTPQQTQCTFLHMLVRGPAGFLPTMDNLFVGAVSNKQIDSIDSEFWTVISRKQFTITRTSSGVGNASSLTSAVNQSGWPTGQYYGSFALQGFQNRIIKVWVPGYKFGKNLTYNNGSEDIKNYSYTSLIIPYGNNMATDPGIIVSGTTMGKMDDYISTFYFKDA